MGWNIVAHSFQLLFRNLSDALKISVGPYLIWVVAAFLLFTLVGVPFSQLSTQPDAATIQMSGFGFVLAWFIAMIGLLFVSSWVAVSWHRFVLLEEYPGMLPALKDRPIWPYVGKAIVLAIVLIIIAIPVGIVVGLILLPFSSDPQNPPVVAAIIVGILFGAVLSWISLRFGLVLPATSVGRPLGLGESWNATKPVAGAIFVAGLILIGINMVASYIVGLILPFPFIAFAISLIINWISIMVGISILTTIYGHVIEGRPIS